MTDITRERILKGLEIVTDPSDREVLNALLAEMDAEEQTQAAQAEAEQARIEAEPSRFGSGFVRSLTEGATLGFSDEIEGRLRSLAGGGKYESLLDSLEEQRQLYSMTHGGTALMGEMLGGVLGGGGLGGLRAAGALGRAATAGRLGQGAQAAIPRAQAAVKSLPTTAQLAGLGAAEGAIYGAGTGGGESGSRAMGALVGAPLGALGGMAGGALAAGVGGAGRGIINSIHRSFGGTDRLMAEKLIRQALENDGFLDIADADIALKRFQEVNPQATILDLGESTLGLGRIFNAQTGGELKIFKDFLGRRKDAQMDDVSEAVRRSMNDRMAGSELLQLIKAGEDAASDAYNVAHAVPNWKVPAALKQYMNTDLLKGYWNNAATTMRSVKQKIPDLAVIEGKTVGRARAADSEIFDQVLKDVNDRINRLINQADGGGNALYTWMQIKNKLMAEISEGGSIPHPNLLKAKELYSSPKALEEARETGFNLLNATRNKNADGVREWFEGLGQREQHAFRTGVVDGIENKLAETPRDRVSGFIRQFNLEKSAKPKMGELLEVAFDDDMALSRFIENISDQAKMAETNAAIASGRAPTGISRGQTPSMLSGYVPGVGEAGNAALSLWRRMRAQGDKRVAGRIAEQGAGLLTDTGTRPSLIRTGEPLISPLERETFAAGVVPGSLAAVQGYFPNFGAPSR